jgi:hypothetical protein
MLVVFISNSLFATNVIQISKELNLYPGTKAIIQWERVFSSQRHLKRYKLDSLPEKTREKLKQYLISHAIDSDKPIVPGL